MSQKERESIAVSFFFQHTLTSHKCPDLLVLEQSYAMGFLQPRSNFAVWNAYNWLKKILKEYIFL